MNMLEICSAGWKKREQHKKGLGQREDTSTPIELEVSFEYLNRDIQNANGYTNFGSEWIDLIRYMIMVNVYWVHTLPLYDAFFMSR